MSTTLLAAPSPFRTTLPAKHSGAHELRDSRNRTLRIAILGCGTIGSCLAETLIRDRVRLAASSGVDLSIVKVLVRRTDIERPVSRKFLTDSFDAVLCARPDVIIEVLGGLEPASDHIRRALESGIPVVTANKTVIAHHGPALRAVARRHGVELLYEAAVCAAVPILSVLGQLRGDRIRSIHGIVNGSTNYVLSRMSTHGLTLEEALAEAKDRGLIEPDPSADLSGRDAAEKLAILAREAGFDGIDYASIDVAGIEHITADDILEARRQGCAIKLVATLERHESDGRGEVSLRVGPTLVPRGHRLASVDHARNAVVIDAELGGELAIEGAGAGPKPTSSALIGDLLRIARLVRGGGLHLSNEVLEEADTLLEAVTPLQSTIGQVRTIENGIRRRHYVRLQTSPRFPSPVDVIEAFREAGVGIKSLDLRAGVARIWTEPADTESIRAAASAIASSADFIIAPVLEGESTPARSHASAHVVQPQALVHLVRRRLSA